MMTVPATTAAALIGRSPAYVAALATRGLLATEVPDGCVRPQISLASLEQFTGRQFAPDHLAQASATLDHSRSLARRRKRGGGDALAS